MKAFDLEKVKAGAKVCTRNGRKVRILCTDLKNSERPICAAIMSEDDKGETYEYALQYFTDGYLCHRKRVDKPDIILDPRMEDLMLVDDGE